MAESTAIHSLAGASPGGHMKRRYCAAKPFDHFLRDVQNNAQLWRAVARRADVPREWVDRMQAIAGRWHLLILVEDWCGDAVHTLPVLAKLAELAGNVDLRVLSRDANPDLMNAHLSPTGGRAIPVVLVLDECFAERGWWGSRPHELQHWFREAGLAMSSEDRYLEMRRWYTRDRGISAVREIVELLERAAQPVLAA
ncbi:MAG: thioredoxin family protein [Gemmatimonadaceae bacterium]